MTTNTIFFNQVFDKKRLKVLIAWVFKEFGEKQALRVVEELKTIGFHNATQAGLSIGLNDLTTPSQKSSLLLKAELDMSICEQAFNGGYITATERNQRIVDTWHRVSETLRKQVVEHFSTYDQLNPVYIMALSGARGNFSQVRQLVGMRGLMADPQGQIISFPIRSNLREGLTLTEYFISCSGARKGLVDTALRTADTGYLTRRLVDVSHHVVIKKICCNTEKGITVRALKSENKILLSLKDRLVGRVLAQNIEYPQKKNKTIQNEESYASQISFRGKNLETFYNAKGLCKALPKTSFLQQKNLVSETAREKIDLHNTFLAQKNQEIDPLLAFKIQTVKEQVIIRSPLTCALTHSVCQLCYGWSLSQGRLVSLGEAVGVIAAQSIGEPGTQLTMRTFHTGGVFSGDLLQEIRAPHSGKIEFSKAFQGLLIRTTDGRIAFLTKTSGEIILKNNPVENKGIKTFLPLNFFSNKGSQKSDDLTSKTLAYFTLKKSFEKTVQKCDFLIRKKYCKNKVFASKAKLCVQKQGFCKDTSLLFSNPFVNSIIPTVNVLRWLFTSSFDFNTNSFDYRMRQYTSRETRYKRTPQISAVLIEFYKNVPCEPFYIALQSKVEFKNPAAKVIFIQAKIRKIYLKGKYTLPIIVGRYSLESYNSLQEKLTRSPVFNSVEHLDLIKKGTLLTKAKDSIVRQKVTNKVKTPNSEASTKTELLQAKTKTLSIRALTPQVKTKNYIVLLLNSNQNKAVLFNKITKYCLLYNYNKIKRNANKTNFSNNQIEQVNKQTCLQFQALSLLFVRQSEYVNKNQLLAQISILGEEGNQPIKSRQTVFAQLSGKVFETQGAVSSKKFIKNINKLSKNAESIVFKHELVNTLKGRASNSIQPEKSAKLGFFHILATQISASFGSNGFEIDSKLTFSDPLFVQKQSKLGSDHKQKRGYSLAFLRKAESVCSLDAIKEAKTQKKSLAFATKFLDSTKLAESNHANCFNTRFSKTCTNTSTLNLPIVRPETVTNSTLYHRAVMGIPDLKNYPKTHSCYNPYTAQFFSSPQNKSVLGSLLKRQLPKIKKSKLLHFSNFKESKIYDQKQQNYDSLFLRTIAQEGDLVDSDYKNCLS